MENTSRRILLVGNNGQLGWELAHVLPRLGSVITASRHDADHYLDLEDSDSIAALIRAVHPDVIVNAAAYTDVERAEDDKPQAMQINATAPGIMAQLAREFDSLLVHYSTDYVFDGESTSPYTETDAPRPLNVYGRSKLAGEQAIESAGGAHLILRCGWVYNRRGRNFLNTVRRLAEVQDTLRIVSDQYGTPTWSRDIAAATAQMLEQCLAEAPGEYSGVYHLPAGGEASWYDFARAIVASMNTAHPVDVTPITTADYPTRAVRPAYSVLSGARAAKTFGITLPPWQESLARCLAE